MDAVPQEGEHYTDAPLQGVAYEGAADCPRSKFRAAPPQILFRNFVFFSPNFAKILMKFVSWLVETILDNFAKFTYAVPAH